MTSGSWKTLLRIAGSLSRGLKSGQDRPTLILIPRSWRSKEIGFFRGLAALLASCVVLSCQEPRSRAGMPSKRPDQPVFPLQVSRSTGPPDSCRQCCLNAPNVLKKRHTPLPRRYIFTADVLRGLTIPVDPPGSPVTMSPRQPHQHYWRRLALGVCAVMIAGCAGLRVPRIDPTGERVFIWPQNQVALPSPITGTVQAPPVYTDPVFPQPALTPGVVPPTAAPGTIQPTVPGLTVAQDRLSITPDRILAPVGSEVILRAGICTTENFLLTDQKVEWLIARESAGEIVELGGKGCCRNPLLPWNKPKKIDNQYAVGYTAKMPLLITRGTENPADDVQVEPGHSWASITSPVEGISNVTAVTPTVADWATRRATATIYWVDVQWTFPPPQITAGGSHVMTTTVRRQTDGTPLKGWVVRYQVAGGAGELTGGQTGQVVEAVTGPDGRANIDVTPTGSAGSVTQINTQLVRPARLAGKDFPRLVVANGVSTIKWSGDSSPYLPEPENLGGDQPTYQPADRGAPFPTQPTPTTSAGRPELDLQVRGASQAQVGSATQFEVVIRNQGDGKATGIVLRDSFDQGLSHQMDRDRTLEIENSRVGSLAAGESRSVFLDFDVLRSGQLCHDVTVRCNEGAEASRRACVNAIEPAPVGQPGLEVNKDGPRQNRVGDTSLFRVVIKNTGEVPLTNVEIVDEYDRVFQPQPVRQGYEIVNGRIVWRLPRLDVGASETFEVQCTCLAPADQACGLVKVTDDSGLMRVDDHCVEILRRDDGIGVTPELGPTTDNTLRLAIVSFSDPVRAGARTSYQILIENRAQRPEEQVQLRVFFPPELTPDVTSVTNSANVHATLVGNELRFEPIAQIRQNERLEFLIPVTINQPGVVNIAAQLTSRAVTTPVQQTEQVEILGR